MLKNSYSEDSNQDSRLEGYGTLFPSQTHQKYTYMWNKSD